MAEWSSGGASRERSDPKHVNVGLTNGCRDVRPLSPTADMSAHTLGAHMEKKQPNPVTGAG